MTFVPAIVYLRCGKQEDAVNEMVGTKGLKRDTSKMDKARRMRNPKKGRFLRYDENTLPEGYDPAVLEAAAIIEESGLPDSEIERRCGVTAPTVSKLRNIETKRPQNKTIDFVARACGYERRYVNVQTGAIRPEKRK